MQGTNTALAAVGAAALFFGLSGCKSSGAHGAGAQVQPTAGPARPEAYPQAALTAAPGAGGYAAPSWQNANNPSPPPSAPFASPTQTASYTGPARQTDASASAAYPPTPVASYGDRRGAAPSDAGAGGGGSCPSCSKGGGSTTGGGGCPSCASGNCRM